MKSWHHRSALPKAPNLGKHFARPLFIRCLYSAPIYRVLCLFLFVLLLSLFAASQSERWFHKRSGRWARALKPGAPLVFTYHHNRQAAYLAAGMATWCLDLNLDRLKWQCSGFRSVLSWKLFALISVIALSELAGRLGLATWTPSALRRGFHLRYGEVALTRSSSLTNKSTRET